MEKPKYPVLLSPEAVVALRQILYGGDAAGIAIGLGVNRYAVQAASLVILLLDRELLVQHVLPVYRVQTRHFLFRPLLPRLRA